ncbi:MAG: putative peroxiredoxin [Caulobacteraceae bacterium]|nr:putative peroxiredoxin [Caulobacteraceae bacterium]
MPMTGKRLPHVILAHLVKGEVRHVDLDKYLAGTRAVIAGVTGAFTPICSEKHVPEFISGAARLRQAGFGKILCICPNDPWTTAAWAEALDPEGAVTFLSDGNLELAEKLGVLFEEPTWFMGRRPRRYLIQTQRAVIERMSIEAAPIVLTCTRAEDVDDHVILPV